MSTPRPLVLVTGLSGAGKASILRILEDLGYETVDNPPLAILDALVEEGTVPMAAGVDARTRGFEPGAALAAVRRLHAMPGVRVSLVYATAEERVLLRRFTETRRRHPLTPGGPLGNRVQDGIAREAALLEPLRAAADWVVDTSDLPVPELRRLVEARFAVEGGPSLNMLVQSFAFPKGLPREADLVFDLRFLRNPFYDPALRPLTGLDPRVAAFVETDEDFAGFWSRLTGFLAPLLPRYVAEGKKYLTIALGCSGGQHRSVHVAERLAAHLRQQGWRVEVAHRELGGSHASVCPLTAAGDDPGAAVAVAAAPPGPPTGHQDQPSNAPPSALAAPPKDPAPSATPMPISPVLKR
ncbi:MAG: RNase adapter RapZ [Rubritepida sp.]|nr:RNase adapter RapZ [Rubritepida sp.]